MRRAVLEEPGLHRAWAELGNIALSAGRYEEASEAYGRAVELGRSDLVERLRLAERLAGTDPRCAVEYALRPARSLQG